MKFLLGVKYSRPYLLQKDSENSTAVAAKRGDVLPVLDDMVVVTEDLADII